MNLNQMSDDDLRKLRDLIDAQLAMRHPGLQLKQRAALFNEPFSVPQPEYHAYKAHDRGCALFTNALKCDCTYDQR